MAKQTLDRLKSDIAVVVSERVQRIPICLFPSSRIGLRSMATFDPDDDDVICIDDE
jgi:hypothetical protein